MKADEISKILRVRVDDVPAIKKQSWRCRIFHRKTIVIDYDGMTPITTCRQCLILAGR